VDQALATSLAKNRKPTAVTTGAVVAGEWHNHFGLATDFRRRSVTDTDDVESGHLCLRLGGGGDSGLPRRA